MTSTLQDRVSQPYRHGIYALQKMKLRSPQTFHDQKFWFFIDSTVNFHSLQQNPLFQIDCPCHERHRAVRTPSWTEDTVVGEKGGPVFGRPAGGG
jgi:hypothetical protein